MSDHERQPADPTERRPEAGRSRRWRTEFPYHWDADDLVSRRQMLNFTVYTSGALFVGTAALAMLGLTVPQTREDVLPIARAEEIPEGEALYFDYPGPGEGAVLLHLAGGRYVAYSQRCTHLACSVFYQPDRERLLCPCHEGVFDPLTGEPVAGPPRRRLARIDLREQDGVIYAVGLRP